MDWGRSRCEGRYHCGGRSHTWDYGQYLMWIGVGLGVRVGITVGGRSRTWDYGQYLLLDWG